jgi:hypothetical protein
MPEQTVTPPNKVSSAYEDLLQSFQTVVEDSNLTLSVPTRPVRSSFLDGGDNTRVIFSHTMFLKSWPCRRLERAKRLHVVIKALETFVRPAWQMTKSTVYINYFVETHTSTTLAQALHFDFVDPGQTDHPFFHVQLSDELIPNVDLNGAGFDLNLSPQPSQCWVTTRIPTPDMTLASVLYCLVADHLGAAKFVQFSEAIQSIENRLPAPAFDSIKRSIGRAPLHFKSSHWFAHMRANN